MLLTVPGFQLPFIGVAFVEDPGNAGAGEPLQIAASAVNVGNTFGLTVCTIVVVTAHCPVLGVNVYVAVVVLSIVAGLHEPLILSSDVAGKVVAAAPLQIAASAVNVGVILPAFTV